MLGAAADQAAMAAVREENVAVVVVEGLVAVRAAAVVV